ncbi:MAG: MerR family transcriptional regulator [Candidatus Pacebacteria bacterium]|nr:MerR family transcriptional regulator [Candidatus Paceibacterota bacterium]
MMLKTKAFAQLCDTTKRTIIYYDEIGLLKPFRRQGFYRLYQPRQVLKYQKIYLLKSFGLSLLEIKKHLPSNRNLLGMFSEKEKTLKNKKEVLEKRLAKIKEFTTNLKKGLPLIVPKIKEIQPYSFYALEKSGRYADISSHQKEIFGMIGDFKFKHVGLTVFYDEGYTPHQARMTTGVLIKSNKIKNFPGIKIIKVPRHQAIAYTHIGSYKYLSYIWQFLNLFFKKEKYQHHPQLFDREFYIVNGAGNRNEENLVTELVIPILPKN